ncbi:MAG: hypothetical protein ACXITV_08230 [Luteibaculaceae bacterium]
MFNRFFPVFAASLLFMLSSCETDVEVNSVFEKEVIVYGLLEQDAPEQFIRVNGSFLVDGDNLAAAQNSELTEFGENDITLVLEELNQNNQVINTLTSNPVLVPKEEGVFFGGQHRVWRVPTPNGLNRDSRYRVNIFAAERNVTAVTNILQWPDADPQARRENNLRPTGNRFLNMMSSNVPGNFVQNLSVRWNPVRDGRQFTITFGVVYDEHKTDGSVTRKEAMQNLRTVRIERLTGTITEQGLVFSPEQAFTTMAARVRTQNENEIVKRVFVSLRFQVIAVNDDVATYISVNQPVTGIVQGVDQFTNVENGLGIFGSRVFLTRNYILSTDPQIDRVHPQTRQELFNGSITGDLKFTEN